MPFRCFVRNDGLDIRMILVLSVTIVCTVFIWLDLIPVFREKKWRECWVYIVIIALVYVSTLLIASGVKIPSPAGPIKKIVSAIWGI